MSARLTWKKVSTEAQLLLVGIPVKRVMLKLYLLLSVMVTIAAVVSVSRLNAGTSSLGNGMELYVIAAAVIGGVALSGGSGTVLGTVLGALVIQFLESGLLLLDVLPLPGDALGVIELPPGALAQVLLEL